MTESDQAKCLVPFHFSMKFIACILCTYHKMLYNSVYSDGCSLDKCQIQIHMVSLVAFVFYSPEFFKSNDSGLYIELALKIPSNTLTHS